MGFDDGSSASQFTRMKEVTVRLAFLQAARGINKTINIDLDETCPRCHGTQCEPGTQPRQCPACNGQGQELLQTGQMYIQRTCRRCHVSGQYIPSPCTQCRGSGHVRQVRKITVPIPAGIQDGQKLRVSVGSDSAVYVTVRVEQSSQFRVDGANVYSDVTVTLAQAVLGGKVTVPGVQEDTLTVSIPSGTSSHERIRIPNKGLPMFNSPGCGDHYLLIRVLIPKTLTEVQRALFLAYAETESAPSKGSVNGLAETSCGKRAIDTTEGYLLSQLKTVLFANSSSSFSKNESNSDGDNNPGSRAQHSGTTKNS
jgi:DnaJ homolog subfamily A member 3